MEQEGIITHYDNKVYINEKRYEEVPIESIKVNDIVLDRFKQEKTVKRHDIKRKASASNRIFLWGNDYKLDQPIVTKVIYKEQDVKRNVYNFFKRLKEKRKQERDEYRKTNSGTISTKSKKEMERGSKEKK